MGQRWVWSATCNGILLHATIPAGKRHQVLPSNKIQSVVLKLSLSMVMNDFRALQFLSPVTGLTANLRSGHEGMKSIKNIIHQKLKVCKQVSNAGDVIIGYQQGSHPKPICVFTWQVSGLLTPAGKKVATRGRSSSSKEPAHQITWKLT